jgi:hypothetical protein
VLQHFRDRSWNVEVSSHVYDYPQWECSLDFPDGGTWDAPYREDVVAQGEDMPTAICRAALKTTL